MHTMEWGERFKPRKELARPGIERLAEVRESFITSQLVMQINRKAFSKKTVVVGRVDMDDLMQQRALIASYDAQRHLHESPVSAIARDQGPGNPVRAVNVYPNGLLPGRAPEAIDLLPLLHGIQAIRFRLAGRHLVRKNLDVAAVCCHRRSSDGRRRQDGDDQRTGDNA